TLSGKSKSWPTGGLVVDETNLTAARALLTSGGSEGTTTHRRRRSQGKSASGRDRRTQAQHKAQHGNRVVRGRHESSTRDGRREAAVCGRGTTSRVPLEPDGSHSVQRLG